MIYSFVARDAGLFKKYGIEPKLVVFDSGSVLAQAAMAGDAKISVTSGPVTIASRTQGADAIRDRQLCEYSAVQHRRRQEHYSMGPTQGKTNRHEPLRLGH